MFCDFTKGVLPENWLIERSKHFFECAAVEALCEGGNFMRRQVSPNLFFAYLPRFKSTCQPVLINPGNALKLQTS